MSGLDRSSFGGHDYTAEEVALGYGSDNDPRFHSEPSPVTDHAQGRRIPDGEWFNEPREPGDYGQMIVEDIGPTWFNRPPNAEPEDPDCVLNANHIVQVHEDGTISVHASIENRFVQGDLVFGAGPISSRVRPWHGYLERGVWRAA